jgi:hypothetical protein
LKENPDALNYSGEEISAYLEHWRSLTRKAYDDIYKKTGHRAIREAELRSISWVMIHFIGGVFKNGFIHNKFLS